MEKRKRLKKRMKGITLIELLVVVAIITILAAILLPYISNRTEDARIAVMEDMISSLRSATTLMFNDMSVYPTQWINFVSPFGTGWRGPYLQRSDTDSNTPETWESGSPWKTDLKLITLNDSATSVRFASSTNLFLLRYGICLVLFNPLSGGAPTIPYSSLQKIDTDLDDGAHNKGYIVHSSTPPGTGTNPPFAANPTMTPENYPPTTVSSTYLYILLSAIP
jgi:prepilin-type N-terminal cleavage/methylation domain-containing protein